ncbi:MAG: FAD-dependent monooxygenase, partial [Phenylobacterium sp.]
DIGLGLSAFPFALVFPQDEHEQLLIERLGDLGVEVERRTELVGFEETRDGVRARLKRPDGGEEICEAAYLAGCDGAHSRVRETLGTGFPGAAYEQLFYVADVEARGPAINGELNIDLDDADFLAVFPMHEDGHVRLIGTVRDARAARAETLAFEDVSQRIIESLKVEIGRVNWFSTYRVHHRVADSFRKGRCFLVGDAAHIHSPAGGQGMNTGIGDAINLAWKLTWVLAGRAGGALLDSYEAERIGFARRLVATTDRGFTAAVDAGPMAAFLRTRLAPRLAPLLLRLGPFRRFFFRTVSQTGIHYRGKALSAGTAGTVQGGDRPPWVRTADGRDNFAGLGATGWQVQVYGRARPELLAWCEGHGVTLQAFAWEPTFRRAGFARDAAYLMRPDGYVALADPTGSPETLAHYFAERDIRPA